VAERSNTAVYWISTFVPSMFEVFGTRIIIIGVGCRRFGGVAR
jgi:hypothetical protein